MDSIHAKTHFLSLLLVQKRDGRGVGKEGAEERWKRSRKGGSRREMEEE
jgi:hypothetical protein